MEKANVSVWPEDRPYGDHYKTFAKKEKFDLKLEV